MNISIVISDDVEDRIRRKAAISGMDLAEYIERMVVVEAEEELPIPPVGENAETFMNRMRTMVLRHGVRSGHVDDSRESIYNGCGE